MDHLLIDTDLEPGIELLPPPDVQRHIKALRLREGDHVRILNGRGSIADAVVILSPDPALRPPSSALRIQSAVHRPPSTDTVVFMGMMDNRDRFEYAIEKLTELGVRRIVPLASAHSSTRIPARERLQAKIRAACEQSGNPWLPLLDEPMSIAQVVAQMQRSDDAERPFVIVGAQNGERPAPLPEGPLWVIVGPEGGLHADEERQLIAAGARAWKVGDQRLRAETAAVALTVAALIERPASA